MAENWIKVRKSLKSDMRIIGASRRLGVPLNEFFGALVAFFCWADEHTADGDLPGLTFADLDEPLVSGLPGFANELETIGWISVNDDGLRINGFEDHMSQSAKKRADALKRQNKRRCHTSVTDLSQKSVTKALLEGEGDRDKSNTKEGRSPRFDWAEAPSGLDTPEVRAAFDDWVAYRRESKFSPWKNRTIRTKLREFEGRPDEFVAAIRHSIGNGYRGIFEPKGSQSKQSHAQRQDSYNHPEDFADDFGGAA